jgi:hypothetical protein
MARVGQQSWYDVTPDGQQFLINANRHPGSSAVHRYQQLARGPKELSDVAASHRPRRRSRRLPKPRAKEIAFSLLGSCILASIPLSPLFWQVLLNERHSCLDFDDLLSQRHQAATTVADRSRIAMPRLSDESRAAAAVGKRLPKGAGDIKPGGDGTHPRSPCRPASLFAS